MPISVSHGHFPAPILGFSHMQGWTYSPLVPPLSHSGHERGRPVKPAAQTSLYGSESSGQAAQSLH